IRFGERQGGADKLLGKETGERWGPGSDKRGNHRRVMAERATLVEANRFLSDSNGFGGGAASWGFLGALVPWSAGFSGNLITSSSPGSTAERRLVRADAGAAFVGLPPAALTRSK